MNEIKNGGNKAREREIIPIVFAANDTYAPYLGVAVYSLIKNTSKAYDYRIYILFTNIGEAAISRIKKMETENVSITFINVSEWFHFNIQLFGNRLPEETTYRLMIPAILHEYTKVLYLDCDIIVQKDVALLYQQDLHDFLLGAIKDPGNKAVLQYFQEILKFPYQDYFNAGILLINCEKFREEGIGEKCLQLLKEEGQRYQFHDQDVLNIICHNRVLYLDTKWNFAWHFMWWGMLEEYKDTLKKIKDPYIMHYTSDMKPWERPDLELAELFWQYARETVFYEEILFKNMPAVQRESTGIQYFFPFELIPKGAVIALYGAGNVGHAFYEQIKRTGYCKIGIWADKNVEKAKEKEFSVNAPEDLLKVYFDKLIIAVEKETVYAEIFKELLQIGVPEEKIVWKSSYR